MIDLVTGHGNAVEYVSNLDGLVTLVGTAYGIGFVSAAQAETIHRPDIVVRPLGGRAPTLTTFLLRREDEPSVLITRFIDRAKSGIHLTERSNL